jgi:hypothetical protein
VGHCDAASVPFLSAQVMQAMGQGQQDSGRQDLIQTAAAGKACLQLGAEPAHAQPLTRSWILVSNRRDGSGMLTMQCMYVCRT